MTTTANISFWLYKSKANSRGLAPIYLRIKHLQKKTELATGVFVLQKHWNAKKERVKPSDPNSGAANATLKHLNERFNKIYKDLLDNNAPYNMETLKARLVTNTESYKTILQVFEMHNRWLDSLVGVDYSLATANSFQLYAVVVFVVVMFATVLKLNIDILFKVIPKATIAYKLLLYAALPLSAASCLKVMNNMPMSYGVALGKALIIPLFQKHKKHPILLHQKIALPYKAP